LEHGRRRGRRLRRLRRAFRGQVLELEGLDRLGLVVLDDREVLALQAAHESARLVADDDGHPDEGHGGLERRPRRCSLRGAGGSRGHGEGGGGEHCCGANQNRSLVWNSMERIGPTWTTWPKVGEFTTVSMPRSGGVLKTFVARTRSESV